MCSTIILGSGPQKFLAANYDINVTHGLVATSLKGTIKENARQAGEKVVRWRVQYGSITFNQSSLELPAFGMNEKGLVIALMWHDEGDFGNDGQFARLNPLQWIQYQLDNCQNIYDVITTLKSVRPRQEIMPLHFMLLDANGDSLIVEFIKGEARLQRNPDIPILTNSSYLRCLAIAQGKNNAAGLSRNSSVARFIRLYQKYCKNQQGKASTLTNFDYLDEVSQTPGGPQPFPWNRDRQSDTVTAWSMHFCPKEKRILFKTHLNELIREISLHEYNFENTMEYTLMDIHDGASGSVNELFEPYTKDHNRRIVQKTGQAFSVPEEVQENLIYLVDTMYTNREIKLD